jgi:glutamyl-tRNA reductase
MSSPGIFVIGANHHKAPIEIRERLAVDETRAASLHADLAALPELREFAVLSTCNRIEFYGVGADGTAAERVQALFCGRQHFDPAEFEKFRLHLQGREALRHLLEVAVGLDSQMLGETEIFGQIKEAYAAAQARHSTGPVLNRMFQKAFQAAKHVRTATAITVGQVSIANVAVELALTIFGSLASTRILLLGAGDIGEKTAKAFQSRGAATLTVASRRLERAMELATQLGAGALPFEQCESRLSEFDVVVCCTAAPTTVISPPAAVAVDTAVAGLDNVFLYNLDDLAKIADENRAAREAEIAKCRALLAERTEMLWRQLEPQLNGANHGAAGSTGSITTVK